MRGTETTPSDRRLGPDTDEVGLRPARTAWLDSGGSWRTTLRGRAVLADPRINKGTAFTTEERAALDLVGMLPPRVLVLEDQVARIYEQYRSLATPLAKHLFLNALRDRNEVLFYRVLSDHVRELLPIIYTPTVGEAIQAYSHHYQRPRGVYLSADEPEAIEASLRAAAAETDGVDLIVATDSEAILGIGDWGVGGMGISLGKLAVYTVAAGIDPDRTIGVELDVGTNNETLLNDPFYLGLRHPRISTAQYERFVDAFVQAASRLFPEALLHWEDLGRENAARVLERYRDQHASFNDDIQATGAVTLAAVLAAVRATGMPLQDHRVVVFGAGTAGIGVADQLRNAMTREGLSDEAATSRIWCVDRYGLLMEGTPGMTDAQRRYARPASEVARWMRDPQLAGIGLAEVVRRVHPTILIGTSGRRGAFDEATVREMAGHVSRPAILPMSNPTELAEAVPADLIRWTDGRALVATGSPFDAVPHNGVTFEIGQANNALIFPGLGLGAIAVRATRVTDGMIYAAARSVSELVDASVPGAPLLAPVDSMRRTSLAAAVAVARAAQEDGVASVAIEAPLAEHISGLMWTPAYRPVLPA
jgi:malate dehydrogenase (oxaloacetate-decarboxylating)